MWARSPLISSCSAAMVIPLWLKTKAEAGALALDNIGERRPNLLVDWSVRIEPGADVSLEQPLAHLAEHLVEVEHADESDVELLPGLGLARDHLW